jgi:hypothetical protein
VSSHNRQSHANWYVLWRDCAKIEENQDRQVNGNGTFYCWAKNKERCDVSVSKEPGFNYKLASDA